MVTITMESSNYTITYPEDKPWDYKVYRHDEDVTKQMANNLILDMVLAIDADNFHKETK